MSLDDLRDQILSNFNEESVKVNQRLLVDKVLARYSSEYVVYRELMQNSDDAKSSCVQIVFETANNKVTRILFKNNGFAFRLEDWNRLKTIAEGNPDEQKIGAFGVGFYSLFSFCENPFVSSGEQGMAFYWRENQLFTKQGPIEDKDKGWTTFLMDTRVPIELPDVEEFARFLANSLVFTVNLQDISVYFNDAMPIQLSKKMQEPKFMNITSEYDVFSPQKLFHLTSVDVRDVQLDAKYQSEKSSIFFRIASGNLDVKVSDAFSAEMERIVKKKPPNKTIIQMIFTGFDEHNSSSKSVSPVFKDLFRYPNQGRLYIGFSTQQTTGCCSHLAARVIPTMERESIDLANKTLAEYNGEMLCLAGKLCRILYEDEMDQMKRIYNEIISVTKEEDIKSIRELLEKRAAHALAHFTFNPSTPNEQVGKIKELQFFNCLKEKLSILSTNGVLPISDVRIPNSEMVGFIKIIPLVPEIILEQCDSFFKKAKNTMKLIIELTPQDVLYELKNRTLSEDEMVKLLKWWISYKTKENNRTEDKKVTKSKKPMYAITVDPTVEFMRLARIGNRPLNTFRYFLNPGIIPPNVDVPDEVFPFTISKNLEIQDLKKWLGWSELALVDWAKFIVNKPNLESDPTFAKKVHQILTKNLNNTSKENKEIIRQLFVQKKCIPTSLGMKFPNEAYFENVNLFPSLPTIDFEKPLSVKNLMELFGVRKVVELGLIFNHLNGQGDFDHMQLLKYLASIQNDLDEEEIKILKNRPIWPKEDLTESKPNGSSNSNSNGCEEMKPKQRFIARDLYIPKPLYRKFGLPVISLKGRWSHNTQEGKFLILLGLQEYPKLGKILELAAPSTDSKIRSEALKYFIDNFGDKYFKDYDPAKVGVAFLPCSDPEIYAKPSECFINPECKIMEFRVIRQDLRFQVGKLGVSQNPNREKLLNRLTQDPPQDEYNAKKIFEYLASQQTHFTDSDLKMLSNFKFIPIKNETQPLASPCSCYLTTQDEILKDFFLYVNFGDIANRFLLSCGVKKEPTLIDYAELLVKSSHKLWNSIGNNVDSYLSILRKIAIDFKHIGTIARKPNLVAAMKEASILVAIKKECHSTSGDNKEFNRSQLASAKDIFINDNIIYQQIFNPLTAPEENDLEFLYKMLGCKSLKKSVKETSTPKGTIRETERSQYFKELIAERSSLFYHNYSKPEIERDEEWLKNIKVREIDYVETSYTLENINHIKKNNTSILQDEKNLWTLYITTSSNILSISQHLVKYIYKFYNWKDIAYLNMLLITPLSNLKEMGYPVDRILKQSNLQYIVDQMVANEDSQYSEANNMPYSSTSYSASFYPGIYSEIITLTNQKTVITFETTQLLRNSLQNAINDCYSNSKDIVISQSNFTNKQTDIDNKQMDIDNEQMDTDNNLVDDDANKNEAFTYYPVNVKIINGNQIDYCEIIPDHLLYNVGKLQEIELYLPSGLDQSEISQALTASLNRFVTMLRDLAEVFKLSPENIHIFYDNNSNTIAFNRDRILFFNLRFYLGLHDEECKTKPTTNAMTYWYMMFCHELSHNFVKNHNSQHEYYFLVLAEIYMLSLLEIVKRREIFW
ncbi:hypothetical protein RhiirA5_500084 [Rhizophagus irregularis]|uniref:Sacsin/Nov domain-containing protein n=3 Tax=Rhizophagus irregularis TaxID=588596 RepID=A0A2I1EJE4_9GLOM|nr:hypothetical protein RhiirA5_500084 [Rhizophagus irregularis]PKC58591.1 hypothetical protein RhiirA1_541000 [Rhizophagus irregularis]PKY22224.1 hypothetical protein RhiirB3_525605 [Rhizophagus irregularis]CAB4474438.1 unnamed protein product [Rhizophagus irregularis]CAB5192916.1 unnamed protein product [Rhizophagus irregularis]